MRRRSGRSAAAARSPCRLPEPSRSPRLPDPARAIAQRESWQPSPAFSNIPLTAVNRVLVTIYLLGREGESIVSGDLYVGGVQPKG